MQPTDEQIRKFWEWCGFDYVGGYTIEWIAPDTTLTFDALPAIDLNNVFKWAVPKLFTWSLGKGWKLCSDTEIRATGEVEAHVQLASFNNPEFLGDASNKDPALALFWAIWKVIEYELANR